MPLTSLPNELLLEIVNLLVEPEMDLEVDDVNEDNTLINHHSCLAIAATCRTIRKVAVSVLYKHIVLDPDKTCIFTLRDILTSDPAAASSVRNLILAPPENRSIPAWTSPKELFRCYRQILNSCSGIRTLLVTAHIKRLSTSEKGFSKSSQFIRGDKKGSKSQTNYGWEVVTRKRNNYAHRFWKKPGNDMPRLLSSIHTHSQKKIDHIEFRGISINQLWKYLHRLKSFTALETFIIAECSIDDSDSQELENLHLKLPQPLPIKTLSITIEDLIEPLQFDEDILTREHTIGDTFASFFPDVRILDLQAPEGVIYGALKKYTSVNKSLTHLTICPRVSMFGGTHLCEVLSALSSRLTHLFVGKGSQTKFCHKLFAGEWRYLKKLIINDSVFPYSCDGIDTSVNLFHLLSLRPAAEVVVYGLCLYVHNIHCECAEDIELVLRQPGKLHHVSDEMFNFPDEGSDLEPEMSDLFFDPVPTAASGVVIDAGDILNLEILGVEGGW